MLSKNGLENRRDTLISSLRISEKKFNDCRDLLKSTKKEINDCKGGIVEIEKLLLESKN